MAASKTRQKYEPPEVVTYQEDQILGQMGPVGGCVSSSYGSGGLAPMNPFGYRRRHRSETRSRRYRSSLRSLYLEDDEEDIEDM